MPIQPRRRLSRRESWLIGAALVLLVLGLTAPDLAAGPHAGSASLSDVRTLMGLPNAVDVLSNLPFLLVGAWGLFLLHRVERGHDHAVGPAHDELPGSALDCAWLFFAGLLVVAAASAFYHLQPDDLLRLAGDRAAMSMAFAGVMGMAVADRVSQRAGWPAACVTLAAGLLAVAAFHETGNVAPWAVVQFGGMALVLWMATMRPVRGATRPMHLKLGWILAAYGLAKVFELADGSIYEFTQHMVSGHSLKHVAAALAALPVVGALKGLARRPVMHNSPAAAVTI
ncbi:MAG: hypothetical protein JSS56_07535 [Proteobacteria bacterium]|nr:hypothetical protein [Pseudomonadota bacterium]